MTITNRLKAVWKALVDDTELVIYIEQDRVVMQPIVDTSELSPDRTLGAWIAIEAYTHHADRYFGVIKPGAMDEIASRAAQYTADGERYPKSRAFNDVLEWNLAKQTSSNAPDDREVQ